MLDMPWLLLKYVFWGPRAFRSAGPLRLDGRVIFRVCPSLLMVGISLDANSFFLDTLSWRDLCSFFVAQVGKRRPIEVVETFRMVGVITVAVNGKEFAPCPGRRTMHSGASESLGAGPCGLAP